MNIQRYSILTIILLCSVSTYAQKLSWKENRACKRVVKYVTYLASDELEGRATGTKGEQKSADYIANQFAKLGLEPKGDNGFLQSFSVTTLRIADAKSSVSINNEPKKLFVDYYPLSYSSNASSVASGVVDVGFGISSEKRNDYLNLDVKGKIVMINRSSPDGIHPHSAWVEWHGINIRVDEAVKRGAVGVVFYRNSEKDEMAESELSLKMKPSTVPVIFLVRPMLVPGEYAFAQINLNILTDADMGNNVIGFKDNGSDKTVIIGAHHDHLGMGGHEGSLAGDAYEVHNGADDNASGVAALLELARSLKKSKKWNSGNNYLFIAFSGEEIGLVGSKYFVENPTIALDKVNYMINMDMVGMLDKESKTLIINGVGTGTYWNECILRLKSSHKGIDNITTTEGGIGPSDHTSFYLKQIPSIHFFTGSHEHYHKPSDDVVNLNFEGEVFVIGYILSMIKDLNGFPAQGFVATTSSDSANRSSSRGSFKVTLGVVPSYTFNGEGMKVDAVREGKPAALAGMKDGDIIISMRNMAVANISDYMEILKSLNTGDKVEVKVKRAEEFVTLNVQF